jgi:N utilization substance protein B
VAGGRRRARAYALQVLYARDVDAQTDVSAAVAEWGSAFDLEVDPEAQDFARCLVAASVESAGRIDELISTASKNWRIDRMSRVDRNILRLGACELIGHASLGEVPVKVVINEAVELAKRFGTAESPAFVNGILDRIAVLIGRSPES